MFLKAINYKALQFLQTHVSRWSLNTEQHCCSSSEMPPNIKINKTLTMNIVGVT